MKNLKRKLGLVASGLGLIGLVGCSGGGVLVGALGDAASNSPSISEKERRGWGVVSGLGQGLHEIEVANAGKPEVNVSQNVNVGQTPQTTVYKPKFELEVGKKYDVFYEGELFSKEATFIERKHNGVYMGYTFLCDGTRLGEPGKKVMITIDEENTTSVIKLDE